MKLAVVTAIPTPYRDPFWNEVAARPNVDLDVYYCASGKQDRPWDVTWAQDYRARFLPSVNLLRWAGADASAWWVRGLQRELRKADYDAVIVGGYSHPSMLQTIHGCIHRRQPYWLMCETYHRRDGWMGRIKDRLLGYICRHAAGGMPTGTLATEYLTNYGIPDDRIVRVPNVPDVRDLRRQGMELREQEAVIRRDLGIPEVGPVVVFVGRMIPKKRPVMTVEAFAAAAPEDTTLLMLGDGPLLDDCRRAAERLKIADRVLLPGFCQPAEVPRYVALATVFVLPSTETWGVAAIEALSLGVPVIVSDEVGCHPDLVRSRDCGTVVSAGSQSSLAAAIGHHTKNVVSAKTIIESSAFITEEFAYDSLAQQTCGYLRTSIRQGD